MIGFSKVTLMYIHSKSFNLKFNRKWLYNNEFSYLCDHSFNFIFLVERSFSRKLYFVMGKDRTFYVHKRETLSNQSICSWFYYFVLFIFDHKSYIEIKATLESMKTLGFIFFIGN